MSISPSITCWNRIEPRPRSREATASLRAEIRDPAWLLGRQWQFGEFSGEDAGSPAFVEVVPRTVPLRRWSAGSTTATISAGKPLERQALSEPFAPDLATRIELGQTFVGLLGAAYKGAIPKAVTDAFAAAAKLPPNKTSPFDPVEDSVLQFLLVVGARSVDGVQILDKARRNEVPPGVPAADVTIVLPVYPKFVTWVDSVFGAIGTDAPAAWDAQHLDNHFTAAVGPEAAPNTTLTVQPDADGRLEWSSFDLQSQPGDPFVGTTPDPMVRVAPTHVRFPGMPANRYWDLEEGDMAFPDVDVEKRDLLKLLIVNFGLVAGVDWFVLPLELPIGRIARLDSLVVRDVFGLRTTISRADEVDKSPSTTRWTMFSAGQPGSGLARFIVLPPSAGPGLLAGPIIEDVRFARDEMANMAWAIERTTEGRMGQPRPGSERDAAVDGAASPSTPGTPDPNVPLTYQVESKVPLNWIPLLAIPDLARQPAIQLQKGRVLRPGAKRTDTPIGSLPLGKILQAEPYLLPEEEIPRAGLRVERVVFRSRWIDGSVHLWIARRRRGGAGETQSGLRFDAALPNLTK